MEEKEERRGSGFSKSHCLPSHSCRRKRGVTEMKRDREREELRRNILPVLLSVCS